MQSPDKATVANLNTTAQALAHLAMQFRADVRQLNAMGLGWLQCRVKKWYSTSESHLDIFLDRILYFDTDPTFDVGSVVGMSSVPDLLTRIQQWITDVLQQAKKFRRAAYDADPDYTSDLYEHLIRDFEKIAYKIERELRLIKQLGEAGYIGARLEDE